MYRFIVAAFLTVGIIFGGAAKAADVTKVKSIVFVSEIGDMTTFATEFFATPSDVDIRRIGNLLGDMVAAEKRQENPGWRPGKKEAKAERKGTTVTYHVTVTGGLIK